MLQYMSQELQESKMSFTSEALDELNVVMEAVREIMNTTAKAFMNGNQDEGSKVAPLGVVITNLCDELKHNHVMRLGNGACGLEQGTVFNDVLNSFTRIAAHCASIISAMQKAGEDNEDIRRNWKRNLFFSGRRVRITEENRWKRKVPQSVRIRSVTITGRRRSEQKPGAECQRSAPDFCYERVRLCTVRFLSCIF